MFQAHVQDEVHHWLSLKMKRIFQRSRLSRSRSKGRIIETAFVSQTQSSTEDLDEVDRLANHPVLRPLDQWPEHRLRKSRSETGGSVDRGLAPWTGSSNHSSPVGVSSSIVGFGSRTVGVSMLTGPKRRAKKPVSRMKRSYTVDFAAAQADDVPVRRRPPSPTRQDSQDEYDEHDPVVVREPPPSNHLVTAIIETGCGQVNPRECITPPPNMHLMSSSTRRSNGSDCKKNNSSSIDEEISVVEAEISVQEATPPNTAPLPTKFGDRHQGNLLRMQLHKKYTNADCDTSSAASTTEVTSLLLPPKSEVVPPLPPPRFKLSLPLKHRLRMEAPSSQDDSSSTDSTPQRRKTPLNTKSRLLLSSSMMSSSPLKQSQDVITEEDPAAKISEVHHHRPRPAAPLLGRKHGPRPSSSSKRGPSSKFFLNLSGESESCSSAMSSMESVRSSNSDSVQSLVSSSESGAGCSMSSSQSNSDLSLPMSKPTLELRTHRSNILSSSKFQVLSPISDKSQEQSSEQGDSNSRTPKVSPTDHILTSCCGGANNHGDTDNNNVVQYNDNQVQHQVDPAPFAMPKLQRRLVEQQQKHEQYYQTSLLKRANSGIQGSDSGISMSSQDVQDMVELLQLPFDMPKLRRKTQHILSRPQSMPTTDNKTVSDSEAKVHHDLQQEDYRPASESNLEWPGPKPDITNGSTMDNYQYQATYRVAPTNFGGVLRSRPSGNFGAVVPTPPPPPGFADDNNQFYLTENNSEADMTTAGINPTMGKIKETVSWEFWESLHLKRFYSKGFSHLKRSFPSLFSPKRPSKVPSKETQTPPKLHQNAQIMSKICRNFS